jgi:hypothetical protein
MFRVWARLGCWSRFGTCPGVAQNGHSEHLHAVGLLGRQPVVTYRVSLVVTTKRNYGKHWRTITFAVTLYDVWQKMILTDLFYIA